MRSAAHCCVLGSDMREWPTYLADQRGDEELGIKIVSIGDKLVFNENGQFNKLANGFISRCQINLLSLTCF